MSVPVTFLLLWGLSLSPVAEAAIFVETRPNLWAEAESLLEPWANVTLTCQARLPTSGLQLFKDGVVQEHVHLDGITMEHRFPLGAVTADTRGLYRCRCAIGKTWTELSNLVEVTGAETLPPPQLSSKPVPWVTPGLKTTLLCQGGLRGVTFLLRRKGDDQFQEVAEAPQGVEATFPVHQAGNYSCSYRTHAAGTPSEPSATVTIQELASPPPPRLSVHGESAEVLRVGAKTSLVCVGPLDSGMEFELRHGDKVLNVERWSTNPDRVVFKLDSLAPGDGGLYTCRYHLHGEDMPWSQDSAPVELLLSDETLPAPELSAASATPFNAPHAMVQMRCRAPRDGLRFALVREDSYRRQVVDLQSPAGSEAVVELVDLSPLDGSNYSCIYADTAPPFAGSAPSPRLELSLNGPLPKPQLRPLWSGAVSPGRDAILRCEIPLRRVPHITFELLQEGEVVATSYSSEDLVLTYVGPQHAGNYRCRYSSRPFVSDLSDPVELQVAGH
ncbi:alpha-1B-glycoprotein [Pteronotus mesoamericanus]|uniref:alpha-1B-glycoprotein n=1 Tax=Pteronotus mesoamericanus TaxID=1884717 RepID=UPI0023ED98A0|nr:alpha-1B-glycoprotein [Pteronotus parnellii mesoamericanus]